MALLLRRRPDAVWVAPLAIIVVRLLLDPVMWAYYLAAPKMVVLVGAALGASRLVLPRGVLRPSWGDSGRLVR